MSAPSFVLPTLAIFFITLGLFSMILLMRRYQDRRVRILPSARALVLVVVVCPWLTLFGSLGSLVTLGGLACTTGFYPNVPAPLPSSVLVTVGPMSSPTSLVTLSARDGSVRRERSFPENNSSVGTTDLSDGVMYIINNTQLTAYRISDGSSLWSTTLMPPGGENEQAFRVYTGDIIADGMVYVSMYDPDSANIPRRIYAVRTSNGSIAWTLFYPSTAYPDSVTFTAGSGLLLVLSTGKGDISAYHASDGSLAWKLPGKLFSNEKTFSPSYGLVFLHSTFYLTTGVGVGVQRIIAIDPGDGHIFWQKDYDAYLDWNSSPNTVFSFGTHLYLHAQGILYALDATNGDILWQRSNLGRNFSYGTAVEAHGVVYVPDDIFLYALNAHDGSLIWKQTGNALSAFGTPLVLQNVILVSSYDTPRLGIHFDICPGFSSEPRKAIFALNARDGSIYWRSAHNTAGALSSAP